MKRSGYRVALLVAVLAVCGCTSVRSTAGSRAGAPSRAAEG